MNKINLREKFSSINDHWNPRIAAELNGQYVKLVKFVGAFTWHHHETEDELFMVVSGRFRREYRDEGLKKGGWRGRGDFIVGPLGVDPRPVADEECEVLLFEPV